MHIGSDHRSVGRYLVDIDGCLRASELRFLRPGDIAALHGGIAEDASIVWEARGESILLGANDRVELNEDCVAFFRTFSRAQTFRSPLTARPGLLALQGHPTPLAA